MSEEMNLKFFKDIDRKEPLNIIDWNKEFVLNLYDGTVKNLKNTVEGGTNVKVVFYIFNDTPYQFGIQKINISDKRIKPSLSSPWIQNNSSVMVTLEYKVPLNPTKNDIIESGKLSIEGYFIIG